MLSTTTGARNRPSLDNSGCIALLEDYTESTYRIDGYLHTLLRSGWFDGVTGIALGSWAKCSPVEEIHDLCLELLGPLGIPMVGEVGFGHGPGAHSIPLGVPGVLRADAGPRSSSGRSRTRARTSLLLRKAGRMTVRADTSRAPRSATILSRG